MKKPSKKALLASISSIIDGGSQEGFTSPIKGRMGRYIVAFTNNNNGESLAIIEEQVRTARSDFDSLTLGGWRDSESGKRFLDVGTSTDSLDLACELGKKRSQIAIWDMVEMEEIRL